MSYLSLLDVPATPAGSGGFAIAASVIALVLLLATILIGGFVILLFWRKRRNSREYTGATRKSTAE